MNLIRFPLTACLGSLVRKSRNTRSNCTRRARLLALGLGLAFLWLVAVHGPTLSAQATQQPIPATKAFDAPAPCSNVQLGGVDILLFGHTIQHVPSPWRGNAEWKAIIVDPSQRPNLQPPTILEGWVTPQPSDQKSSDQSTSEVAEEDLWWTHNTHDFTFKVIPDPAYQHLLSSWVNPDGTTGVHTDMEVEWDNASLMDEHEGFQRIWGAVPEFVWPAVGDRVWVSGRWIFDCGHPSSSDVPHVQFSTEIHPPRALVAFRLNHPALDSFPTARVSAPNFPAPQSYLPVTGEPVILSPDAPNSGPTNVPVTEADIFVSGNGAAANDLCSITPYPCAGHTSPFIPVSDRNYVFDIYPPGTCYGPAAFCNPPDNGTLKVSSPVPDASLQWRMVDHSSELPTHACGGNDKNVCLTVDPIICLIDASTPPPNQSETSCPSVPPHPTRLRVILPFAGSNANFFAQSILLGWDDVPTPANSTLGVRTFQVRLHELTVKDNGSGCCNDSDWRVFVNVGGQYRYISRLFDAKSDGTSVCNGADPLTENGNGDCYRFDSIPWTVSVQDGTPIHVAVGGFVARGLEDPNSDIRLCHPDNYFVGCDSPTTNDFNDATTEPFEDLGLDNDDRIGTYEFDLGGPDYSAPAPVTTVQFGCTVFSLTGCSLRYRVEFNVQEVPQAAAPVSAPLVIGNPNFAGAGGTFITAATPMIPQTEDPNVEGFQYRFHRQGDPLPTYDSTLPFPVHWTHADLAPSAHSVEVHIDSANSGDGPYDFQYSAENFAQRLEPRHTATVVLDTKPPVIGIVQPQPTNYPHCGVLTLSYTVDDGTGSGVASFTPTMDGHTTLPGISNLLNGQRIDLLTAMKLGTHAFSVTATDNVSNTGATSVPFTIIVTTDSLKCDVTEFLSGGCIDNAGIANALTSKLSAAQAAISRGNIQTAINTLTALKDQISAQAGKHISTSCTIGAVGINPATALLLDVQALIDSLRVSTIADPITGYAVNASGVGVPGATVSILDGGGNSVATASTDITGYYFFATTGILVPGSGYTVAVTGLPAGFSISTPAASSAFTWAGTGMMIGNFVLN